MLINIFNRLGAPGATLSPEECAAFGVPNGSSWCSGPGYAPTGTGYAAGFSSPGGYATTGGFSAAPMASYGAEPEASY